MIPRYMEKPKTYSSIQAIERTNPTILDPERQEKKREEEEQLLSIADDPNRALETTESQQLFAPNVLLTGHQREVLCCKFSYDGKYLATAGFDKLILLWDVYKQCNNFGVLKGHKNAILDLHWSMDNTKLYTSSADKTVSCWDAETFRRIKKFTGHTSFVNSCYPTRRGQELIVSGSDDNTAKIWDMRQRDPVHTIENKYQVTAVTFNDAADRVFIGGLDNQVKVWDIRKGDVDYVLYGHTDTITGLSLSPEGSYLLSNSMDLTIRCWDVKSFVIGNRCVKIFQGNSHGYEKNLLKVAWSADGSRVTAGSADRYAYVWDTTTRKILHKLGGHTGSVNETCFNPQGNLIASCSSDRTVIVGELSS